LPSTIKSFINSIKLTSGHQKGIAILTSQSMCPIERMQYILGVCE